MTRPPHPRLILSTPSSICRNSQAVMIDIVIMLINIIRMYMPPEFRWSMFMIVLDRFLGATVVATLVFCLWHSLQGQYADIPHVSEAVYIQGKASCRIEQPISRGFF